MEPVVFLIALSMLVGVPAIVVLKIARLRADRAASPSANVTSRFEALESDVQSLRQELAETQERLDFAERLLTKAREERRIGP
jgi:predicted  nucleic acid-binding Zn-ribbon protein